MQHSRTYIFVILQESRKTEERHNVVHYDFLGEPGKSMCTYNILFLKFCESYSLSLIFYEKVQIMQFQIWKKKIIIKDGA